MGRIIRVLWICAVMQAAVAWAEPRWSVSVGPSQRSGGTLSMSLDTERVEAMINPVWGSGYENRADLPPATGYADREYEDGFVFRDPGTADPESYEPGLTWNWGYESSDQYDGETLRFKLSGESFRKDVEEFPLLPYGESDDIDATSVEILARCEFPINENAEWGVQAGVSLYSSRSLSGGGRQRVATERERTWTYYDYYEVPGYSPPDAPYAGTYEGPGPLIHNVPDRREERLVRDIQREWHAESFARFEFDQTDVRLGPVLTLRPHDRVVVRVSPQLEIAIVDFEAQSRLRVVSSEKRISQDESFSESATEVLFGGGVDLSVSVRLWQRWWMDLAASYCWWDDDVVVDCDPYVFVYEQGEWTCSARLGVELH